MNSIIGGGAGYRSKIPISPLLHKKIYSNYVVLNIVFSVAKMWYLWINEYKYVDNANTSGVYPICMY